MTHFLACFAHCATAFRKAYLPNALLSSNLSFFTRFAHFLPFSHAAALLSISFQVRLSFFELLYNSSRASPPHGWVSGTNYNFLHLGNEKIVFSDNNRASLVVTQQSIKEDLESLGAMASKKAMKDDSFFSFASSSLKVYCRHM